ncbi:MAG TPA: carbohydrate ABC transporter permease, partial [Roseiflexaceae bacterium]|nr:carbohydrate ABC transporter permease [Roseiflexaceae bacterium]
MLAEQNAAPTLRWGRKRRAQVANLLTHIALIAVSMLVLLPLAFQLSTSLKTAGEVFIFPPAWIPDPVRWENYADAVTA